MKHAEADRLIARQVPHDEPELGEVASLLDALDQAYPPSSTEHCEATHVARMVEAAHLTPSDAEPILTSAEQREQRSMAMHKFFEPWWSKVAAGAVGIVLMSGGMAFAGLLPDPVQSSVADALNTIGVDVDNPAEEEAVEAAREAEEQAREAAEEAAEQAREVEEEAAEQAAEAELGRELDDDDDDSSAQVGKKSDDDSDDATEASDDDADDDSDDDAAEDSDDDDQADTDDEDDDDQDAVDEDVDEDDDDGEDD